MNVVSHFGSIEAVGVWAVGNAFTTTDVLQITNILTRPSIADVIIRMGNDSAGKEMIHVYNSRINSRRLQIGVQCILWGYYPCKQ